MYNGRHDLLMMSVNLSDIAILNIKSTDYRCIISGVSKNEVINVEVTSKLIVPWVKFLTPNLRLGWHNEFG